MAFAIFNPVKNTHFFKKDGTPFKTKGAAQRELTRMKKGVEVCLDKDWPLGQLRHVDKFTIVEV
jgi:hypothetical protein